MSPLSQIQDQVHGETGESYGKARAPAAAGHHNGSAGLSHVKATSNEPEANSNGRNRTRQKVRRIFSQLTVTFSPDFRGRGENRGANQNLCVCRAKKKSADNFSVGHFKFSYLEIFRCSVIIFFSFFNFCFQKNIEPLPQIFLSKLC